MAGRADVVDLLARTELFGSLAKAVRAAVVDQMQEVSFTAGQQIFGHGDASREVYLMLNGRVRLSILSGEGRAIAFKHACDGEIFGEIAALDGGPRSTDATALTVVRAMTLSQAALRHLIETRPQMADAAIKFVCRRLRETTLQVADIVLQPVEVRLARFLSHSATLSAPRATTVLLDLGISQGELALLLGAGRQKINTALAALESAGAIERVGGGLRCDVAALARIAQLD